MANIDTSIRGVVMKHMLKFENSFLENFLKVMMWSNVNGFFVIIPVA